MSKTQTRSTLSVTDAETVERLATAFNRCFETLEADEDTFAESVFCDLYPPLWRFQLQGRETFAAQLRAISAGPTTTRALRVLPTSTGFVLEHEEVQHGIEHTEIARRLWLCEVGDGRITDVLGYCNGGWDDDLRSRHADEAPMLRPWETDR